MATQYADDEFASSNSPPAKRYAKRQKRARRMPDDADSELDEDTDLHFEHDVPVVLVR